VSSPLFTVVTVCRDDLQGVERTWASLLVQTCREWEWLVVDGASTDGTVDWLAAVADDRVRWISEPDDGIYDAMNKGIVAASGDLVLFLNAGDTLARRSVLTTVADSWGSSGWHWAYGRVRVVDADGQPLREASFEPFRRALLRLGYRAIPHQAAFFNRSLLRELEYRLDLGVAADQEMMLRASVRQRPWLLKLTVSDFVAGGASWGRAPDAFVRDAQAIRADEDDFILSSRRLDAVATEALAADKRARTWIRRHLLREPVRW
jgi:glycosyltransferase involved in cell wall biosynthesis